MSRTRKKLFVTTAEHVPMEFYFFPLEASLSNFSVVKQEKQLITELVKAHGGVVLEKQGDFTIPLGHALIRENYPCFEEVYSVKFVIDCMQSGQIMKLATYRLNRLVMYDDNFDPNGILERKQEWTFWLDSPPNTFVPRPFKLTQETMAPMHFLLQPLPLRVPQTELDSLKEDIRNLACKIDTAYGRVCSCLDDYAIRLGFDHLKHYYPQDVEIYSHTYIDDVLKIEGFPKLADYRLFETLYDDDCNPDEVLWQRKKWSDYKLKSLQPIPSVGSVSAPSEAFEEPPSPKEKVAGQSIPPRQESEPEDVAFDDASNYTSQLTLKKERQPDFSSAEQTAILKYITDKNAYGKVGGNALWQEMERDGVCPGRSFHSLRNHYIKKLQNIIHTFRKILTPVQMEHFRLKEPIKDKPNLIPSVEPRCSEIRKGKNRVIEQKSSRVVVVASVSTSPDVPPEESETEWEDAPPFHPSSPRRQSVKHDKILPISTNPSQAKINEDVSPVAGPSDDGEPKRVLKTSNNQNKRKKTPRNSARRAPYSKDDDMAIINFVTEVKGFDSTKGTDLWKKMERRNILKGRTWQAMKERFKVHICPNLETYDLSDELIDRFKRGWSNHRGLGGRPSHSVASTICLDSSSDDESESPSPVQMQSEARREESDRGKKRKKLPRAVAHPAFVYGTSSSESPDIPNNP